MLNLRLNLFTHGRKAFLELLHEQKIPFTEKQFRTDSVQASPELVIAIVGVTVPAVAQVLVAWLQARAIRKITIQIGTRIVHLEGQSIDEEKKMLAAADKTQEDVTAIMIQTANGDAYSDHS